MIERLFQPFQKDLLHFMQVEFDLPSEQARVGRDILYHTFTGLILSNILKGNIAEIYKQAYFAKDDKSEMIRGNLVITCRNEFDRQLDIDPSVSRVLALYLVYFILDEIRRNFEEKYDQRNLHTFKHYLLKAA